MNSDGDKIGLGRFFATLSPPPPFRFPCVAYLRVAGAMMTSRQEKKKKA